MNFAFSLIQGLASAVAVWILYAAIPSFVWNKMPKKYSKHKKSAMASISILIFGIVTYTSAMTYGPRIALNKTVLPESPQTHSLQTGSEFITEKRRIGQFDKRLEDEQ